MTTITNNKLTDERVSNATLIRLIQWAEQHNSHYVAAALCELQERRKADSAEPAGYHVIKECGKVGCSVTTLEEAEKTRDFWNKRWTIRPYFYTQPALVVPETLPCSVELKPGLIIGKGCKTEILLTALKRRADYYAELEAMTPGERAERDAGIEAFKAMLPTPADSQGRPRAPVVPDDWVMVPKEPTRQMMAQGHFAMKGTDRGKFRRIYQAMITAAPDLNKGGINAE